MSMATKLGRIVTFHEGIPLRKSHDPLTTWSCEITWQTKNIFTTTKPMATKLGSVMTYLEGLLPIKSYDFLIIWLYEIMWQTRNHPYYDGYSHQTWEVGDIQ